MSFWSGPPQTPPTWNPVFGAFEGGLGGGQKMTSLFPRSGQWAHQARSMGPPKASKLLFCRWFNGIWCVHKLFEQFSTLYGSKTENCAKTIFDIVTTHNDEISYVKHVLDPICAFFTLFGCSRGGYQGTKGHHLLLCSFLALAAQK